MRDAIGNKITDKSLLCWHPSAEFIAKGMIVQAVQVSDGGISMGDSGQLTPAMLVIQIPILVEMGKKAGQEPTLAEVLCVVNPQAEAAIEKMLEGRPKQ